MNLFLRFYVPVAVHLTSVDLVLTTSELSIRVRDSTATFVIKAIQPRRKIVITTSELPIMVRDSSELSIRMRDFVNPSLHKPAWSEGCFNHRVYNFFLKNHVKISRLSHQKSC